MPALYVREVMIALQANHYDPKIFKQSLEAKRLSYRTPPVKKMVRREYTKILNKEKDLKRRVLYGKKSF